MTSTIAGDTTPASTRPVARGLDAARAVARLRDAMASGPLVLDAGMGTRLLARGLVLRRDDPCLWNLDHPDVVLDVHRRDVAAGARVLFTNTFGANRAWLARYGRRGDLAAINRAGVQLALSAMGPSGFVLGDIGPSGLAQPGAAEEQATILIEAGVDGLVLETFRFEEAIAALRAVRPDGRPSPSVPIIVSLWQWPGGVEEAARQLVEAGADVLGLNCRPAIGDMLSLVERIAGAVACPLMVKPGVAPGDPAGSSTPAAFAGLLPDLLEHGVRLIGGCCGTTEAHVAAISRACTVHRTAKTPERRGTAP